MKRWFQPPQLITVARGQYARWDTSLDSASDIAQFLGEAGSRVIATYMAPLEYLRGSDTTIPVNATEFADRLFDSEGNITDEFIAFAGEVIAAWAEESFAGHELALPPAPHESRPAFDAISLGEDQNGMYICLIQGKTTAGNTLHEADLGARQLGRLDKGEFQRELAAALETIARGLPNLNAQKALFTALVDPSKRRYVVSIIHEDSASVNVLGRYDYHVPGPLERRAARFLRFIPWEGAWKAIGESAHAEAARRSS